MEKMHTNGNNFAERTRDYRIALRQKILMLREEGYQISIIEKLAKGDEEVADLELQMNLAETLYKASQENIMIMKKMLDSVEADIAREWNRRE